MGWYLVNPTLSFRTRVAKVCNPDSDMTDKKWIENQREVSAYLDSFPPQLTY